jgi:hypothetical protein
VHVQYMYEVSVYNTSRMWWTLFPLRSFEAEHGVHRPQFCIPRDSTVLFSDVSGTVYSTRTTVHPCESHCDGHCSRTVHVPYSIESSVHQRDSLSQQYCTVQYMSIQTIKGRKYSVVRYINTVHHCTTMLQNSFSTAIRRTRF